MMDFKIISAGDACLVVLFDERIDLGINMRCVAAAEAIQRRAYSGVRDVVPTYHTIAIYFDPLQADAEYLRREVEREVAREPGTMNAAPAPIEIPVCYGGECGPDLSNVAEFAGCSEEEVVHLHASVVYRVYMLGFVPGFAYMGQVSARIAAPRLRTPRLRVPRRKSNAVWNQSRV